MNTLIENGYVIENAKDLLLDSDYKVLDIISDNICASDKNNIDFYQFDYCLTKNDVDYFNLKGHRASVKFSERVDFQNNNEKIHIIEMKKKIIEKYFDSIQTYAESFYKKDTIDLLCKKISHKIADKYYSHIFNLNNNKKNQIQKTTDRIAVYDSDCHITKHRDGYSDKKLFVILIYLNKEWGESNGGDLVIYDKNNYKVTLAPKAPSVCILDFTKNNLQHEVLKVLSGIRYTYVSFYEVSDSLASTNEWKEHKIKNRF